jgi:hypothetical protein
MIPRRKCWIPTVGFLRGRTQGNVSGRAITRGAPLLPEALFDGVRRHHIREEVDPGDESGPDPSKTKHRVFSIMIESKGHLKNL